MKFTVSALKVHSRADNDLPHDGLAAVTAAIRVRDRRRPISHAPRLDPLRAALVRLEAATGSKPIVRPEGPAASQSRQAGAAINRPLVLGPVVT